MQNFNTLISILFVVLLFSCSDSKKKKEHKEEKQAAESLFRSVSDKSLIKDYFVFDILALVEKEDNFQLFYTEEYLMSFSDKNKITQRINKNIEFQNIEFNLPKDVFPERYRIDVGSNRLQEKIIIKSITVRYSKNEIVIPQDSIKEYLVPNLYIKRYKEDYYLNTIEKDGVLTYDPYFTCSPKFIRLLSEL